MAPHWDDLTRDLGPSLGATRDRLNDLLRLALDRAALHASDPARYPLDVGQRSLERVALAFIERQSPARRKKLAARVARWRGDPDSALHRRLSRWPGIDLGNRAPVFAQPATRKHVKSLRLPPEALQDAARAWQPRGLTARAPQGGAPARRPARPVAVKPTDWRDPLEVAERLAGPGAIRDHLPSEIAARYRTLGGESGALGRPLSAEEDYAGGRIRRYQHGAIAWSSRTGAWEVMGRVLKKWEGGGGGASLGFPVHPGFDVAGGRGGGGGRFQGFEKVLLVDHPDHGASIVRIGPILSRWLDRLWTGDLGFPIGDEESIAGGVAQSFVGGRIVWATHPEEGPEYVADVHGPIFVKYAELMRGERHPDDPSEEHRKPGWPMADEEPILDGKGRIQSFGNLSITWSEATGAHAVWRAPEEFLRRYWSGKTWLYGWQVGLPNRDVWITDAGRRAALRCEAGTVLGYRDGYGVQQVGALHAAAWDRWVRDGAEAGPLGWPLVADSYGTYRADAAKPEWLQCADTDLLTPFQGGYLHQSGSGEAHVRRAFQKLSCRIGRVHCGHETSPAGDDELGVGGVVIDTDLQVKRFGPTRIGTFVTGNDRPVSVPLWDFDMTRPGWPKACAVQIVLYEEDDGGIINFLEDYQEEVVWALAEAAGSAAELASAEVEALLLVLIGEASLASLGGALVAVLVAAAASVIIGWINDAFEDDEFPVLISDQSVSSLLFRDVPGYTQTETLRVDAHGGWYEIDVQWSIS